MGDQSFVSIRVKGRPLRARSDLSLLNALARDTVPVLGRSLKYHRPRGPSCGTGQCAGCLVRVNGEPSVRSCQRLPKEGDRVSTERGWPSTRYDLLRIFDHIFPQHMDTLHGFTRPSFMRPLYQRFIRPFSGFGKLPEGPGAPFPPPERVETDFLVVGGGRSAETAMRELQHLVGEARILQVGYPKRPLRQHSLVHLPPPMDGSFTALAFREGSGVLSVKAKSVLLCTGAYDSALLFEGNDLPGVMTGEGAETLALGERGPPFHKSLLFGGGARAEQLFSTLGGRVAAIASPGPIKPSLAVAAERAGIPVHPSQMVIFAKGGPSVRQVRLLDRSSHRSMDIPIDSFVTAHRRIPHSTAFFQAGAKMIWDSAREAYYPSLSESGETTTPSLFAAGRVAGFHSDPDIDASARRAVQGMVAGVAGSKIGALPTPAVRSSRAHNDGDGGVGDVPRTPMLPYYREYLKLKQKSKVMLCPCEDVCLSDLDDVMKEGWGGLETAKRMSAVGMGLCQGRYCLPEAILVLSILEGKPPAEIGFITQRPPIWPIPIGSLAAVSGGVDA